MGTYHFAIQHNGKFHKCFLNEDGELWIPDEKGQPKAVKSPPVDSPERAREIALTIIRDPGNIV